MFISIILRWSDWLGGDLPGLDYPLNYTIPEGSGLQIEGTPGPSSLYGSIKICCGQEWLSSALVDCPAALLPAEEMPNSCDSCVDNLQINYCIALYVELPLKLIRKL